MQLYYLTFAVATLVGAHAQYNCATREVWPPEKAAWCCENKQVGCQGAADSSDAWSQLVVNVLIPFALFCACYGFYRWRMFKQWRRNGWLKQGERPPVIESSLTQMTLMGCWVCTWSLVLMDWTFFDETLSIGSFLVMEMTSMKNIFHAGLLVSGYSCFMRTGNRRYLSYTLGSLVFTFVAALTYLVLTLVQLSQFGWQALPSVILVAVFALFCGNTIRLQSRAYKATKHTTFAAITEGLDKFKARVDEELSQNPAYPRLQKRLFWGLALECVMFVMYNVGMLALNSDLAARVPFRVFVGSFVDAFTMAIHSGWIVVNGFHALSCRCVGSMYIYLLLQYIFVFLSLFELVNTGVHTFTQPAEGGAGWCQVGSFVFLLFYSSIQVANALAARQLTFLFSSLNMNYFISTSSELSHSIGIWQFSFLRAAGITNSMRSWAKVAAVMVVASFAVRLLSCMLIIVDHGSLFALSEALNFVAHSSVIFLLQFYRSVSDYKNNLSRSKNIQTGVFVLFLTKFSAEMASLLIAVRNQGWRPNFIIIAWFLSLKILIVFLGAFAFFKIKPPNNTGKRLFLCIRRRASYDQLPQEVEMQGSCQNASDEGSEMEGDESDRIEDVSLVKDAEVSRDVRKTDSKFVLTATTWPAPPQDSPVTLKYAKLSSHAFNSFVACWIVFGLITIGYVIVGDNLVFGLSLTISRHRPAFEIAFHFLFLFPAYAYRGLKVCNGLFVEVISYFIFDLSALLIVVFLVSLSARHVLDHLEVYWYYCLIIGVPIMLIQTVPAIRLVWYVRSHPSVFPQNVVSFI